MALSASLMMTFVDTCLHTSQPASFSLPAAKTQIIPFFFMNATSGFVEPDMTLKKQQNKFMTKSTFIFSSLTNHGIARHITGLAEGPTAPLRGLRHHSSQISTPCLFEKMFLHGRIAQSPSVSTTCKHTYT